MPGRASAHLIALDIGTSQTKAILYRVGSGLSGQEIESYTASYPRPGFSEQDPEAVLAATLKVIPRLLQRTGVAPEAIAALVFGGIWQSMLPVDRKGTALCPALTWADTRSIAQTRRLKARLDPEEIKRRTGCSLHPMYFLPRLAWLREEAPEVFKRADRFISIKEYILEHLFGSRQVDFSIASGTGIWNMQRLSWDEQLLAEVGLDPGRFSECVEPAFPLPGLKREPAALLGLRAGTPGIIGAADGALAHLGSVGLADNRMSLTVGTGAALRRRLRAPELIPGSEAWCYYLAEGNWLLGGVLPGAGNTLHWFADNLMPAVAGTPGTFEEMNRLAAQTSPGADGLCFLPLLAGERCPNDRPDARGCIWGLAFGHTRAHMVRALMEGVAYNLYAIYRMLTGETARDLVVTGGIQKSPVWLQIVADVFGKTLWLPEVQEASAWGGVLLGLRAIGQYASLAEAAALVKEADSRVPDRETHDRYRRLFAAYERIHSGIYRSGLYQTFQEENQ